MLHPSHWPTGNTPLTRLYKEEWGKTNTHICKPYAKRRFNEVERPPITLPFGGSYRPIPTTPTQYPKPPIPRFDRALPIKAAAITIAIILLSLVNIIRPERLPVTFSSLAKAAMVVNLTSIFVVTLVYDYVTAHRKFLTQELYGAILSSIIISMWSVLRSRTAVDLITSTILVFVALYLGYWIANRRKVHKIVQFFGALFILLLIAEVIGLTAPGSGNSLLGVPNNTVSNDLTPFAHNAASTLDKAYTEINPAVNSTWANEFFDNVSRVRGTKYNYCPILSQFAKTRFRTMASNPNISHYGYAQNFNTYWPYGYSQGDTVYTGFGEEVFYPSGYTPTEYVNQVINTAPIHWQELSNTNLTYYGFYIANGPAYEIIGACPNTEIPGPNINITQFFAQQGCSLQMSNLTYFVIEIASVCPQSA